MANGGGRSILHQTQKISRFNFDLVVFIPRLNKSFEMSMWAASRDEVHRRILDETGEGGAQIIKIEQTRPRSTSAVVDRQIAAAQTVVDQVVEQILAEANHDLSKLSAV
jgi:hypothetical protein